MTIKRRINLSFIAIGALFFLNLAIYFVNDQRRADSADSLRRSINRQPILTDLQQSLTNIQKQIALLSEVMAEQHTGADPSDYARFAEEIAKDEARVAELKTLEDADLRPKVEEFAKLFHELGQSWIVVYQNLGVHHPKAVMELAMRADPLSQRALGELLPAILA